VLAPVWAANRARARYVQAAYEAAKWTRLSKMRGDNRSGTAVTEGAAKTIRGNARELEQNYDLAVSALDTLVKFTIGAMGVRMEPMAKLVSGELAVDFNRQLAAIVAEYNRRPEVTGELDAAAADRLLARSWFRDGEVFTQYLVGKVPRYEYATDLQFAFEMIECDRVPEDYNDKSKDIKQGIQRNGWGRATNFYISKDHPGDTFRNDYRTIPADRVSHIKTASRIGQNRGVSVFASVFNRIEALKDAEESENVAMRVAAAVVMTLNKNERYVPDKNKVLDTQLNFAPGTVFNPEVGVEPEILASERPNTNLIQYLNSQKRSASGGLGVGASSILKEYNGTFSAQRQELIESWVQYMVLRSSYVCAKKQPEYTHIVKMAVLNGLVDVPSDIDIRTLYMAEAKGPPMPWFDPQKEVGAVLDAINGSIMSKSQAIRERSGDPESVFNEIEREKERLGSSTESAATARADERGIIRLIERVRQNENMV
jgi:lambda family phage portal protein